MGVQNKKNNIHEFLISEDLYRSSQNSMVSQPSPYYYREEEWQIISKTCGSAFLLTEMNVVKAHQTCSD